MTAIDILNIPLKLLKRYRKDKSLWELFVLAVCMKINSGDSAIKNPTPTLIKRFFGCSYYKAERLLNKAKQCNELFAYYEKADLLIARSFTHNKLERREYCSGRTTFVAYKTFCYKLRYNSSDKISHYNLSRLLKDKLLIYAMKARQLKNDLPAVANNNKISTRSHRFHALYQRKLAALAGVHRTTVSRHVRKMERQGELRIIESDLIVIANRRTGQLYTNNEMLLCRRPFAHHDYLCVRDAFEYIVASNNKDTFVNIIFNHRGRHRRNKQTTSKQGESRTEYLKRTCLAHLWN